MYNLDNGRFKSSETVHFMICKYKKFSDQSIILSGESKKPPHKKKAAP